jgi:hypothetical protein
MRERGEQNRDPLRHLQKIYVGAVWGIAGWAKRGGDAKLKTGEKLASETARY